MFEQAKINPSDVASVTLFLSQNDGTILSGGMASRLPIRTFSSGPTNSMRGAAYLAHGETNEAMMVVDIGKCFSASY